MKRKLFTIVASLAVVLMFSGCSDHSGIEAQLNAVEIENMLPDVYDSEFSTMAEAEDAIYDQQIAACEMLSDSYNQTYYMNFTENIKGSEKRVAEMCTRKRQAINAEIEALYMENLNTIMEDVEDCPNVEAFVLKTYNNVLTFYDEYNSYKNAENPEQAITDILVYYYDRNNILAKSFLARNEDEVFKSAVAVIEGNAQADDEYRFYINKNNTIIKALNEIYGGLPAEYAHRVETASDKLAINLINSLESLTSKERGMLMDELGLSTPTPSPRPTATPRPSASPSPVPTLTPRPTTKPTAKPTTKPAAKPTTKPAATSKPSDDDSEEQQNPTYILD